MPQRAAFRHRLHAWVAAFALITVRCAVGVASSSSATSADLVDEAPGLSGGLCVHVGADDLSAVLPWAQTGRFLVQVIETAPSRIDQARQELQSQGLYGLVSVDGFPSPGRLPYTENLVNVLIVRGGPAPLVPLAEAVRVLRPGGVVFHASQTGIEAGLKAAGLQDVRTVQRGGSWLVGRKPWPDQMDQWTHPRHAADGNAVSHDTLVGPPRRVRWVAGPSVEISNLVSAAGRNFYGGVWARDAFNGLRLWQRALRPSPAQGSFTYALARGAVPPVASGDRLLVVSEEKLLALDGATGEVVREYPEAGLPSDVMVVDGILIAVDQQSVRAIELGSGRLRWKYETAEPRYVIAGDGAVYLLQGAVRRGEKIVAVSLDLATGQVRWQNSAFPWAPKVRRSVYHRGLVLYEVSTLSDDKPNNAIHVVSSADGRLVWSREYVPGMQHMKQARPLGIGELIWVLENRKGVALDPRTGQVKQECPAGFCHCFPPVATERYLLAGEMELTDLGTGQLDANRITKAACGRDYGWVPANGLIYVCPKHCVCWPMLRGYAAMAPALPAAEPKRDPQEADFPLEKGVDPPAPTPSDSQDQWPCYRHDAWRSGSSSAAVPIPEKPLWTAKLGLWPEGTIAADWRENPFVRGPITPPVVAGSLVYVARPDAHQVVALDVRTGAVRWRFTANGRIDTPPTIHRGLCLLGTRSGWVYCLRADDGRLVWRLRAAPNEERIIAYGQIESPWPVPGSVLVVDDVAYFAAGRQPLADGGILVFALDPPSGKIRWVKRLDSLPMTDFYACVGLEFDNFDLLQREDDAVAMSRWLFRLADGQMTCKAREAFLVARTGGSGVIVPRGCWSYAPRHQPRHSKDTPHRGLVVFRDNVLFGCHDDGRTLYRRDFDLDGGEKFDRTWITGWAAGENARKGAEFWLSHRLAQKAAWSVPVFAETEPKQQVVAMVLAGERLFLAGSQGGLKVISTKDGQTLARIGLPAPVWDGMAAAAGRLFVSTTDGDVICLGRQ